MDETQILDYKSSRNFSQDEIGECIFDVVLQEGDFLYAPRGTIHQCIASENEHSLHITLSTALNTNWGEYLTQLMPIAIKQAVDENIELRKTLPINYHQHSGTQYSGLNNDTQQYILNKSIELIRNIMNNSSSLPIDNAVDNMAINYMNYRVPPSIDNNINNYNNMIRRKKNTT